jgi:acetyl esterase/lipase
LLIPLNSPELVIWKENNTVPILNYRDPVALRAFQEPDALQRFAVLQDTGEVVSIPMRDGYYSALRVYKPKPPIQQSALVVLAFGGGFVCGDNRQLAGYAIGLRELYGATVVLPSYRLAPENPFPVSQNDVWDSLVWIAENAHTVLGADPLSGFILGGASAGGNLAAALGQKWVDEQRSPKLSGLWLSIPPIFNDISDVPLEYQDVFLARDQNKFADIVNGEVLDAVFELQKADTKSPLYSPCNSTNPQKYANLARDDIRVYFQAAGQDVLRDDCLIYERILRKHGVDTKIDVYNGVWPNDHYLGSRLRIWLTSFYRSLMPTSLICLF